MPVISLPAPDDVYAWRAAARGALMAGFAPEQIDWRVEGDHPMLVTVIDRPAMANGRRAPRVPRAFIDLVEIALLHADTSRFALSYRLLWRLQDDPTLISAASDSDVRSLAALVKSVRRDLHKMRAFVRFRRVVAGDGSEAFIAWFEPEHHIVRANAPFFADRFTGMRWSILTPGTSAHWDGTKLSFGSGASRHDVPDGDALETLWRQYYASIFNPARLMPEAMLRQMPKKYWKNLPEATLIDGLIASAPGRSRAMMSRPANPKAKRRRMAGSARPEAPAGNRSDGL